MEVKDITDRIDSVVDVAAGAVIAATNPAAEADRLERKGTPVRQRVHRDRPHEPHTQIARRRAACSHRSIVSGSATRPTSPTPDARITARTCTTFA